MNYDSALTSVSHYNIAVAFQPKDREESNLFKKKQPSPSLQSPSGEDNLFVSNEKAGCIAVGVADGVGGWSEAGYDSSAISRELCASLRDNLNQVLRVIQSSYYHWHLKKFCLLHKWKLEEQLPV